MRKLTPIFLLFAAFFFIGVAITLAYGRAAKAPAPQPVHVVTLTDHALPAQLIIPMGDSVRFDNGDGMPHTISAKAGQDGPTTASWDIPAGQGVPVTFNKAGTFDYSDRQHPGASVKIIVFDPNK